MDMTDWGEGPWLDEPDTLTFESSGYNCKLRRSMASGSWCGYVYIPEGHPLYKCEHYDDEEVLSLEVHGGVTFFEHCEMGANDKKIVIIGFDTAHANDFSPLIEAFWGRCTTPEMTESRKRRDELYEIYNIPKRCYKTMQWVRQETERLAAQCKQIEELEREKHQELN